VASAEFEQAYYSRFGHHPGWSAVNGYDALTLFYLGSRKDKSGPAIAKFLSTLSDYSGAAGTYSATGDGRFTLPAAVKVVREDSFERIRGAGE